MEKNDGLRPEQEREASGASEDAGAAGAGTHHASTKDQPQNGEYRPGQDTFDTPALDRAARRQVKVSRELLDLLESIGDFKFATRDQRLKTLELICAHIADGASLAKLCRVPGMVTKNTFLRWVADDQEMQVLYNTALLMRAEVFADELVDLADSAMDAGTSEEVQGIKLAVNTRQWVASRLLPKRYGDHQIVEHTGQVTMDEKQVDKRLEYLIQRLGFSPAKDITNG